VQEDCKHEGRSRTTTREKTEEKTALRKCAGSDIIFLSSPFAFAAASSSS
jgi:hypothetical protein